VSNLDEVPQTDRCVQLERCLLAVHQYHPNKRLDERDQDLAHLVVGAVLDENASDFEDALRIVEKPKGTSMRVMSCGLRVLSSAELASSVSRIWKHSRMYGWKSE